MAYRNLIYTSWEWFFSAFRILRVTRECIYLFHILIMNIEYAARLILFHQNSISITWQRIYRTCQNIQLDYNKCTTLKRAIRLTATIVHDCWLLISTIDVRYNTVYGRVIDGRIVGYVLLWTSVAIISNY